MYALGEIIQRVGHGEILGAHLYVNARGIRQGLPEDHVELVVDSDQKQA
jgi:hypothetical protein